MTRLCEWRKLGLPILDAFIWYAYLLILIVISFVSDYYSSQVWLLISACAYLLSGLCALSAINGGRCNWYGLQRAKVALLIVAAMLVLLFLQISIPIRQHTDLVLLSGSSLSGLAPDWFNPAGFWSVVPEKTRWLLSSELLVFSIFLLSIALVSSRRRLKQLLSVILVVGLLHSLVGIVAKYGGLTLVDAQQLDGHFSAARAWFINRNHFAAFISLCMAAALALQIKALMSAKGNGPMSMMLYQLIGYRLLYSVALTLGVMALVLSQSRAGFLSFSVSLLSVLILFGRPALANQLAFRRRNIILPATAILLALVIYFGGELVLRFSTVSLLGERVSQWSITWQAIQQAWLLGYGGNSYADVFQVYRGSEDFRQVIFNQAHNDYLHIWLEQGLLGLTLWLGLLVLVLRAAFLAFRKSVSTLGQAVLVSVAAVLIAALAQSVVDFNLQILNIRVYFFVIMSLVFSVPAIGHKRGAEENSVPV
ncbi:MAG: O-antigen ligase [Arenicella sp.]